ncbi:MAG: hypothetical protein KGJ01_00815 [Patescibacteria group bacterium]|nr:hypothetical protein [Patescibacteria group bacterium]
MTLGIIIIVLVLLVLLPTAYASLIGAPFVPASPSLVEKIVDAADVKEGDVIYELGAGNGQVMIAFAKRKGVKVLGFELSPVLYLVAWLNLKLKRLRNCHLYLKNFYSYPLAKADVVYFFLVPRTVNKLAVKLVSELKPGSRVISYAFPIDGWEPSRVIKENGKSGIFVYTV